MSTPENYTQTMQEYGVSVRQLFVPPQAEAEAGGEPLRVVAFRGGGEWPLDTLADSAEALTGTTRSAGELTAAVLEAGAPPEQEAAEVKLLAQAAAQIDVARELLQAAEDQLEDERAGRAPADVKVRSARSTGLAQAVDALGTAIEMPLAIALPLAMRGVEDRPKALEPARGDLETEIQLTLRQITRQTARTGGKALRTLLKMDSDTLLKGVRAINQELAEHLDRIIKDASKFIKRIVDSAVRLVLQAYDWVLNLLGKDAESAARKKVKEWIDELKAEPEKDEETLADQLVTRIYGPEAIRTETGAWVAASENVPGLNQTAEDVSSLGHRYAEKSGRVDSFLTAINVLGALPVPIVKLPQFQVLLAAVALGLLGYTLYTGYDHVDSGRVTFYKKFGVNIPDRVKGVRATVREGLAVAEAPAEGD